MKASTPLPPPLAVGETLPAACGWYEVCRVFGIRKSAFHRLDSVGAFDAFKLHPPIGPRRFSGALLQAYLRGESATLTRSTAKLRAVK